MFLRTAPSPHASLKLRSPLSGMSFLHRVSFHSVPFSPPPRRTRRTLQMAALAPPPACPASGSLFRAYRARARAGVGAGAVRAPDCAREAEDAPLPCVSQGFSKTAPLGRATPKKRLRTPLLPFTAYHRISYVKPIFGIISEIENISADRHGPPVEKGRYCPAIRAMNASPACIPAGSMPWPRPGRPWVSTSNPSASSAAAASAMDE